MVFQYSREEAWLMFESGVDFAAAVDVDVVEEEDIVKNCRRGDCCDRSGSGRIGWYMRYIRWKGTGEYIDIDR